MHRRHYASLAFWALARHATRTAEDAVPGVLLLSSPLDLEEPAQLREEEASAIPQDAPSIRHAA